VGEPSPQWGWGTTCITSGQGGMPPQVLGAAWGGAPGRLRVESGKFPGRDGMLPQVLDTACGWGRHCMFPGRDGMLLDT
jgi:hypothetical protein